MPANATIALDLSRLLSRAGRETATGIDRVELAYAGHALAHEPRSCFAAIGPLGSIGLLPRDAVASFVAETAAAWRGEADRVRGMLRLSRRLRAGTLWRGGALAAQMRHGGKCPVYLLVSHHHLEQRAAIERLKTKTGGRFVCLIHDLIPIRFPEYAKPGQNTAHLRRIESAVALADAVIVNSTITRDTLLPHLGRTGRKVPVVVAPFGTDLPDLPEDGAPPLDRPYFVYVSTIEARKNHLLLLNLWRDMAESLGPEAPLLVLIGARGWESENVFDMLDRCPAVRDLVIEHSALPDGEMVRLLRGARAVLLPSFAEGFGFPLLEGMALGAPALCSDIPALRENGGGVPEYLHPLDGLGWRQALLDYAAPQSPRRTAQLERLKHWRPASWADHFAAVDALIDQAVSG
ncbi:MAG TPA: glycosyltransferase family 1 protein [Stellaceae bacterium]|jgi:glycosyltransferase involved in cell wall biosynthesis|nr:glycosyltransferase family 1 protein [Stellaceae bacterium]